MSNPSEKKNLGPHPLHKEETVEPHYYEPLYNEAIDIMNEFLYPSNSNTYGKEPRYNGTSLERTNLASPLALHYIEVPLCSSVFWDLTICG